MFRSLRSRILAGYGVTLALTALVLAVALGNVRHLADATDAILRDNYRSLVAADRMTDALERHDRGLLLVLAGDPGGREQTEAAVDSFAVWYGRAAANVTEPGEDRALVRLDSAYRGYRVLAGGLDRAVEPRVYYRSRLSPAFEAARTEVDRVRALNHHAIYASSQRARTVGERAQWTTLGIGLAAIGAGLAFSLLLAGALVRPLRAMRAAAERIGRGDYDVQLAADADDELGALSRQMNAMAGQLGAFHALGVQQLVAEKRKTEAVLDAVADGVVVVDEGLRVVASNPAAEAVLGPLPPGRTLGSPDAGPFAPMIAEVRAALAADGRAGPDDPPQFVLADVAGRPRQIQFVVSRMDGLPGGAPAAVLLLRDLTSVQDAERLKSEFIMAASHELRTPLTGMEMALGMLRAPVADRLDARDQDLFDVLLDEQRRLAVLAEDLLELARMEAGQADLHVEPVDPRALLDAAASRFAAQADAQGVRVAADPGPPLPAVCVDPDRIGLVLSNLVANALRYVPSGGRVRLSASVEGGALTLSVVDDGPGVPAEARDRIFDPLVQVRDGRPRGGSGLGLAICRSIVRAHGGTLRVEDASGGAEPRGAAFVVVLPHALRGSSGVA